ncbi:transport and Golgi organization protein 1 homolog isoform X3 [Lates calcarifer]|uniref:Transport and Golgi organization protein 1 homolog n=1 Tax=Lates calcarifer TaxID=8187 RepID=A0AAJ8B887_LATCA|nr:transport and Golgi organization protein 1 homolog isoform X3 [Lates calcarifer]
MAAKHFYRQGFLLLLFNFISTAALEKRFSDFKRCADEECSMLLVRGKAVKDFSGPDCRFLSFKKSETIYVYYKLAGRRADMWAGSVGSLFGYFPKDLLGVNHIYTDKEFEVPAEETDFVCFDTGFDKFDNYDIDSLLGSSVEQNDSENKGTSDQTQVAEGTPKETQPSEEVTDSEKETEHQDNLEDLDIVPDDQSASLPELDMTAESDTAMTPDGRAEELDQKNAQESVLENVVSERSETKDTPTKSEVEPVPKDEFVSEKEPVSISEGAQIPKLKTTFGTTFDAVTTDDKITKKSTPYEEEESKDLEDHHEDIVDVLEETPLLSFSEEKEPVSNSEGVQIPKLETTFGTTFDAVTTDDEITKTVTPYEEEESEAVENLPKDNTDAEEETPLLSFSEENKPVSISEGAQIPKLKTTFGATFDAVTTDDEITKKVTPYEEEEGKDVENHPKDNTDVIKETPLLSFSEEAVKSSASDSLKQQETPPTAQDDKPQPEEKNMWTSIGDAVFSVVTGGEMTPHDLSSEEDEDDEDEEEEAAAKTPPILEEALKHVEEPLTIESPKEPEKIEHVPRDPLDSRSVQIDNKEIVSDSERLLFNHDDEHDGEVVGHEGDWNETLKPTDDTIAIPEAEKSNIKTTDEPIEHKEEVSKDSDISDDNADLQDSSIAMEHRQDLENVLEENKTVTDQETHQDQFTDEIHSRDLHVQDHEKAVEDSLPNQTPDHLMTQFDSNNSQPDLSVKEPEIREEPHREESDDETEAELVEENVEEKEELLEDENALSFSQSDTTDSGKPSLEMESTPEPEYSDSVMRLTLLRDHFTEEDMGRVQRLLGLKNLFKVESMFSDLDIELQATRLSHEGTTQDIENALEGILEASENTILDEIEKMLDSRNTEHDLDHHMDTRSLDEETEILDDFQELAFSLRQKYSTASDSTPLATEEASDIDQDENEWNVEEEIPHSVKDDKIDHIPETESEDNLTVTDHEEQPAETEKQQIVLDEAHARPDVSVEEDGGHFNKNKDSQPGFSTSDEMQKVPQATLENSLDMGLGVEVEHSPSGSLDSLDSVSEIHEEEVGLLSTGIVYMGCIFSIIKSKIVEWTTVMISLLPEEWKPGETLYGCPWQAVVITALVGVVTFTLFFWRTVLAVKKREYLVDEKRFTEQIQALKKEKNDALTKMSELQKQTEQLRENQKQSKETVSCTMKKIQDLESKVLAAESRNKQMAEEKNSYTKLLEEERSNSAANETRIEKLEKSNEKLQLSRKKIQEALAKTTVLLDEAKIREDARNVQHKCLEKEYTALKEENKTLKATIKGWEDKHKELSEQIKSYQKSQKDLEDSVVLKDHNVEVLSELLADLDACDLQKGDTKVLANGEIAPDKKTAIKNRIKQMMDVSRVQTTLTVVEEERDRFMTKLLHEEKTRKALEEQHQQLEHAIATLKGEKSHVENQFKILQQKNEIMVEMYQQKENALQQRLTKEELERRSKENLLSEVGGKALEAEEQVKVLRQRINEMEDQMKKTEEVYKEQIKEQENKTHSNWVNARNAERALNQEKLESSKLREKLAVLTSQLNERRAPLFRPNSGQPAGPRQGPRPPSDPHGRYPENKHISGMDMMGPRSSSPANMDVSTQAVDPQIKAEAQGEASTESPEPGPGSFLASPIRDSPGPMVQGPPPGPHDPLLPPGPHGRLPPPGPYRPPRPGPYHLPPGPPPPNGPPPLHGPPLPANGHPGMPLPGPMGGEFGPRPTNGHAFHPRPGPGHAVDPRGPPPPHFRPPPPHHFGPMPPPHGVRGPMGPRPPIPPDMRFPGPRDLASPPMDLPPGVPPHPAHPGDAYGQVPPNALHNSAGAHSGAGQDLHVKQEAPQDSARPTMVKP